MEKEAHNDAFLRDLIRKQEPEKAPAGFTEAVMGRLQPEAEPKAERILSTGTWAAILLGAAAVVTMFVVIDMPFLDRIFSDGRIQRVSMDIFTNRFYESFGSILGFLKQNLVGFMIFLAFLTLVVVERLISRRRSYNAVIIL